MAFERTMIKHRPLAALVFVIAVAVALPTATVAAAPVISTERVQLRTQADGIVGVTVSATIEDLDGLNEIRVTVERPGVFGPFPLQKGLYLSPNDTPTLDTYTVTIGPEFIGAAHRAGDYVITVSDGTTQVSATANLPAGLTALPPGGATSVDTSTGLLRPTISVPPVAGATGYRISITNDSDSTTESFDGVAGADLSSVPSIRVGTGRLEAGKFYRLNIDMFDTLTVDASNVRSESTEICYDPATGRTDIPCITQKDVHLITESSGQVVMQVISRVLDRDDLNYLRNPPPTIPPTTPVTVSRGALGPFQLTASLLRDIDIDSDVTDRFTSSRNPLDETQIPVDQRAGDYTFRAQDSSGNVVSVSRDFPSGLSPLPPAGALTIDPSTGALTPTVSIAPVPGATNYRVVVFNDTDSTRKNFDNLPGGTLSESPVVQIFPGVIEPGKLYRIHMEAFNNQTFSTTTVRSRSNSLVYDPSGLDADGDGIQNSIDGQFAGGFVDQSAAASNSFTNLHLGGTVSGTILDRADLDVIVAAPADASTGVRLGAADGTGTATVNACLPTVDIQLTDRDAVAIDCGSLLTEVLDGVIEILLGDSGVVIAPGGAILAIRETSPGQYSVESAPESLVAATLVIDGQEIVLPPGTAGLAISTVEIKPGDGPNCVNPQSKGVIPVAILGGNIDVRQIVKSSLEIDDDASAATAGVRPSKIALKDINGDGVRDMILHFKTQSLVAAGLVSDNLTLYVTGRLKNGALLLGSDVINLPTSTQCNSTL